MDFSTILKILSFFKGKPIVSLLILAISGYTYYTNNKEQVNRIINKFGILQELKQKIKN